MYKAAHGVGTYQSEQPPNNQDNSDCVEHDIPLYDRLSMTLPRRLPDERVGHFFYLVVSPRSLLTSDPSCCLICRVPRTGSSLCQLNAPAFLLIVRGSKGSQRYGIC